MPKKGGKKKTQPKKAQEAPEPTPATPADDDGDDDVQEEVKKGEAVCDYICMFTTLRWCDTASIV
jgi:hypothetical protein